jgi:hypothetical protein
VGTPPFRDRPIANYTRNQSRGGFQKQSKPLKSAAIRTRNYDRVARAAGEFADTGQGSVAGNAISRLLVAKHLSKLVQR